MIGSEVCDKLGLMVDNKKTCIPLYSSPRPGGIPAANGFHQVSSLEHALICIFSPFICRQAFWLRIGTQNICNLQDRFPVVDLHQS